MELRFATMVRAHMNARAIAFAVCVALMVPVMAWAQDSVVAEAVGPRPALEAPLSPQRAFLYSLVLPGYAQSVLGRGRTGTLFVAFESVALVMIRESAGGLREARRNLADSVIVSYVNSNGQPDLRFERTPFSQALVRSRQEQVEDWIAVLVGNHLFSAIDAYVAAHLWDVPIEVAVRAGPGARTLALRLNW